MIKVLIVDDSVLFSEMLKKRLLEYSSIEVVGIAHDPYEARDMILEFEPNIMTLDVEMPKMDGVKFLKKLLPQYPMSVIMISSMESKKEEAIEAGALDFRVKPAYSDNAALGKFIRNIVSDIIKYGNSKYSDVKAAPAAAPKTSGAAPLPSSKILRTPLSPSVSRATPLDKLPKSSDVPLPPKPAGLYSRGGIEIVALGASTGGTDALEKVVMGLPKDCPPVIITQHMPPVFTKMYSERLNRTTPLAVFEAVDGMRLEKGMCVIAEGGKHMELMRDAKGYYITSKEGSKVSGHCPSVDVMFKSAAGCSGKNTIAALLTGMGADGAQGLLQLRKAGAYTIGQNKETCVVYGMPMEAYKLGAVCEEVALDDISKTLMKKMGY